MHYNGQGLKKNGQESSNLKKQEERLLKFLLLVPKCRGDFLDRFLDEPNLKSADTLQHI